MNDYLRGLEMIIDYAYLTNMQHNHFVVFFFKSINIMMTDEYLENRFYLNM